MNKAARLKEQIKMWREAAATAKTEKDRSYCERRKSQAEWELQEENERRAKFWERK